MSIVTNSFSTKYNKVDTFYCGDTMNYTLNDLPLNTKGKIKYLNCKGNIKRRLLDLGLVKDTFITPVLTSPSKGLRAFYVRGSLLAIRDEDALNIFIYKI